MIIVEFVMKNIYFLLIYGLLFMCDFILGVRYAYKTNTVSSNRMKDGGWKFIGYYIVMFACILFDVMLYLGTDLPILKEFSPISKIAIVIICLNEFISIIENADKLEMNVPKILLKLIKTIKENNNEE